MGRPLCWILLRIRGTHPVTGHVPVTSPLPKPEALDASASLSLSLFAWRVVQSVRLDVCKTRDLYGTMHTSEISPSLSLLAWRLVQPVKRDLCEYIPLSLLLCCSVHQGRIADTRASVMNQFPLTLFPLIELREATREEEQATQP